MFQLDFAIFVILVGGIAGALKNKVTITLALLALAYFTLTYGIGWGLVTLLELVIGYTVANVLFGKRYSTTNREDQESENSQTQNGAPPNLPRSAPDTDEPNDGSGKAFAFVGDEIFCGTCGYREILTTDRYLSEVRKPSCKTKILKRGELSGTAVQVPCQSCKRSIMELI